jgi:NAD(P)-dependent dehydrogenase (short-subunit alcohol dehydrogenase family)
VGQAFYEQCRALVIGAQNARALVAAAQGEPQGLMHMSCPSGMIETVAPLLAGLAGRPTFKEASLAASPIGHAAEPEEMAGMVLHLCSDEASFANGQVFIMDGGQTSL